MVLGSRVGKFKYFPNFFPYYALLFMALTTFVLNVSCRNSSRLTNRHQIVSFTERKNNNNYLPISHHKVVLSYAKGLTKHTKQKNKPGHKSKMSRHDHGYETEHHKKEVDTTLDDLLEVMGPHLFLVPFVLKALPFAIPALPLSYILSRYAPATIPELITQLMEFANQINEAMQGTTTGANEG